VAPDSFLDDTNSPGGPPFRYDWQGVLESVPNGHGLNVQGDIDPDDFGYNWTLTSACGTFTNSASPIPGHIPPSSISGNSVTGTLTLEVMAGAVHTGATNSKQIVIYKDHLARDMENFVSPPIMDTAAGWVQEGGSAKIVMACHDSTTHAYKGEKGTADFWTNWTMLASVQITNGNYAVPALGSLTRGDIVAYYGRSTNLLHSQTCTGNGNDTWGANNKTLAEQDPYTFAVRAAGAHYTNWSSPEYPITITSYDKP
jgi:hypothetical protein